MNIRKLSTDLVSLLIVFFLTSTGNCQEAWKEAAVGVPSGGSSTYDAATGRVSITASGSGIAGFADSFHFVHRELTGDGSFTARVANFSQGGSNALAGLMFRETLSPHSKHGAVLLNRSNQVQLHSRTQIGGNTALVTKTATPTWLRLVRSGTTLTAYYSFDGAVWTTVGTATVSFGSKIFCGFAISNQNSAGTASAEFDTAVLPWRLSDVGAVPQAGTVGFSGWPVRYAIQSSGVDPSTKSDVFSLLHRPLAGDGEIVTKVESFTNAASGARAGIMIREGEGSNAPFVMMSVSPSGAGAFRTRTRASAAATNAAFTATLPIWLKVVRKGTAFQGYRSLDGINWTLAGSATISMTAASLGGLAVGSQSVTPCTAVLSNVSFMELWVNQSIGTVGLSGSCHYRADLGAFDVEGAGAGVRSTVDAHHFVSRAMTGDGQIVARISDLATSDTQAGIMIRGGLTQDAPHASVLVTQAGNVIFSHRSVTGGSTTSLSVPGAVGSVWLRLMRVGSNFSAFWSADGEVWNLVGTQAISLASSSSVGLVVTSQSAGRLDTATFDGVSVGPVDTDGDNLSDSWETQYFGSLLQGWGDDSDGDGYANGVEFEGNSLPNDAYDGATVMLSKISGDQQKGDPFAFLPQPLVVLLHRAGNPISGAAAQFSVYSVDAGYLATSTTGALVRTLGLTTDATGKATAYFQHGAYATFPVTINVSSSSLSTSFSSSVKETLSTPVLNPDGGKFVTPTFVSVTSVPGTNLHFTLNGSTPTQADPAVQSGQSILIPYSATLRVKGFRADYLPSAVKTATYTVVGKVTAGYLSTLAIKTDGSHFTWGDNALGQLGLGDNLPRPSPTKVLQPTDLVDIVAGTYHVLALTRNGEVWAWGHGVSGTLGDGQGQDSNLPVRVQGLSGVVGVAAGSWHSLAVKSDGTVWAWGQNGSGQLGNGNLLTQNLPVQVAGLSGVKAISGGEVHSVALKTDGTVWSWGGNGSGQLGTGRTRDSKSPVQATGLTTVASISSAGGYTIALRTNGEVWAWGTNASGQLGVGNLLNQTKPIRSTALSGIASISAGYEHALALSTTGVVWGWGANGDGRIGLGNQTATIPTPTQVSAGTGVVQVAAGRIYSLFVKNTAAVSFAGNNQFGQYGSGSADSIIRSSPVAIPGFSLLPEADAPTFNPPGGAFASSSVAVQVASASIGSVVRYTLNGQDPVQTDSAVPASGTISVPVPSTLKALAWAPGRTPSQVSSASFTLAELDSDGDGLSDRDELELGTNPAKRDSDGDGVDDNVEITNGTDPRLNNGFNDPDNDGLTNAEEAFLSSDPNLSNLPNGPTGIIRLHTPLE